MIDPSQNLLMPQGQVATPMQQPQLSPQEIDRYHTNLSDLQDSVKELINLPDEELNLSKLYAAASDLITENKLSKGQRGATAMEVASELSGPDFPKEVNGQKPTAQQIRKYLLNHFNRYARMQAVLTTKFGGMQNDN